MKSDYNGHGVWCKHAFIFLEKWKKSRWKILKRTSALCNKSTIEKKQWKISLIKSIDIKWCATLYFVVLFKRWQFTNEKKHIYEIVWMTVFRDSKMQRLVIKMIEQDLLLTKLQVKWQNNTFDGKSISRNKSA